MLKIYLLNRWLFTSFYPFLFWSSTCSLRAPNSFSPSFCWRVNQRWESTPFDLFQFLFFHLFIDPLLVFFSFLKDNIRPINRCLVLISWSLLINLFYFISYWLKLLPHFLIKSFAFLVDLRLKYIVCLFRALQTFQSGIFGTLDTTNRLKLTTKTTTMRGNVGDIIWLLLIFIFFLNLLDYPTSGAIHSSKIVIKLCSSPHKVLVSIMIFVLILVIKEDLHSFVESFKFFLVLKLEVDGNRSTLTILFFMLRF